MRAKDVNALLIDPMTNDVCGEMSRPAPSVPDPRACTILVPRTIARAAPGICSLCNSSRMYWSIAPKSGCEAGACALEVALAFRHPPRTRRRMPAESRNLLKARSYCSGCESGRPSVRFKNCVDPIHHIEPVRSRNCPLTSNRCRSPGADANRLQLTPRDRRNVTPAHVRYRKERRWK